MSAPMTGIIVAKCLGSSKLSGRFRFGFKGTFNGCAIRGVQIAVNDFQPIEGTEYLIYSSIRNRSGILIGKALRIKQIEGEF